MSESSLDQVKKLAQELPPGERKHLFNFLAELPDSGIGTGSLDPPAPILSPENKKTVEDSAAQDNPIVLSTNTFASIFLKGRPIFTLFFYPDNYRQSRMEVPSWKDATPTEKIKEELRRAIALVSGGKKEITDDEIIEACKRTSMELFQAHLTGITTGISTLLPKMVWLLFEAGIKIVELGHQNYFAERTSQRKKTLDEMVAELEPFWKQIKEILNATPGGRRNVKHSWSATDLICLDINYQRLKPIWREAKKAAKEAQLAKETNRRTRWKEALSAIYQAENLPSDLIDLLALPQSTPPSEIALTHAARICVPEVSYSTKVLKEKLISLKRPARTADRAAEK